MAIDFERVDRVILQVDDLDAAIDRFSRLLGASFVVVVNEEVGTKAALSDCGIELIARSSPDVATSTEGNSVGMLVSVVLKVPDLEAAKVAAEEQGLRLYRDIQVETPDGLKECLFDKETFGGIPIALEEYPGESFVAAVGADLAADPTSYEATTSVTPER